MGGMRTSLIIIIALALLACLVVIGSRPDGRGERARIDLLQESEP
jgi:hypothetical protein